MDTLEALFVIFLVLFFAIFLGKGNISGVVYWALRCRPAPQLDHGHYRPEKVIPAESGELREPSMDQISIKAPTPKCRLFLKIDQ